MALRNIRVIGDRVLEKVCKPVKEVNARIKTLIEDMYETMYDACGVGLAAPQVGVLRRIVVIDCDGENPILLINPEIIETSGSQTGDEGCLSVPGKCATVTRADHVKVRAYDIDMNEFELEGDGLLARAIQHECDHLDGVLYTMKAESPLRDMAEEEEFDEELLAEAEAEMAAGGEA